MMITKGQWRVEAISDRVRIVVGRGRAKLILATLRTKQVPEAETVANASLMEMAPRLAKALIAIADSGLMSGTDHPIDICGCGKCAVQRLAKRAKELI
jgi:hypothetical protein